LKSSVSQTAQRQPAKQQSTRKAESTYQVMTIDTLLNGKIRVKLLTRLLLNPASRVYLRGLEKDFGVSSNTVRVELNKLSDLKLIEVDETVTAQKQYKANTLHPMFTPLRNFILKQFGFESLIEQVFQKLGEVESVYITNDWAEGKESTFVDLVVVGDVNKNYMNRLIEHAEKVIQKKIRVAVYETNFSESEIIGVPFIKLI
jgi:hypothetical protein